MAKAKTAEKKPSPRHFMANAALSKSVGEGRGKAFLENPCEETMQAILDAAHANLTALMKELKKEMKAGGAKKAPAEKKPAKKAAAKKAPADNDNKAEKKPAKKAAAAKTPAKKAAAAKKPAKKADAKKAA